MPQRQKLSCNEPLATPPCFVLQFTRAVEMKQVAEQDAERAKFVVMKAEQERNAAVIKAEVSGASRQGVGQC